MGPKIMPCYLEMPDNQNSMGKQQWVVNESESIPPNISTWVLNYLVDFQWLKRTSPTRYKKKKKNEIQIQYTF